MVSGLEMNGHQDVGMFVLLGSSSVSFNKMAEKSNERLFSKIDSVIKRLSQSV